MIHERVPWVNCFLMSLRNGSQVCPEWIVTTKFHWNVTGFIKGAETRRKDSCIR